MSPECPGHLFDTRGHSRDTFWTLLSPGAEGPRRHPVGHPPRTPPVFGDTLGDTPETLRARRARKTPVAGRRDRNANSSNVWRCVRSIYPLGRRIADTTQRKGSELLIQGVEVLKVLSVPSIPFAKNLSPNEYRYRPKGVFGKGVGNSKNASEMRQTCVENASKMRQNGSCFIGKRSRNVPKCVRNASNLRPKCVKNARNTFGGEHLLDDTENKTEPTSAF